MKWLAFLLGFALSVPLANAQLPMEPIPSGTAAVNNYVGPADAAPSLTNCWSLRACSKAIAIAGTQNAYQLRRDSDAHTCVWNANVTAGAGSSVSCSNGGDVGDTVATFCNSTTCRVIGIWDQLTNTKAPGITGDNTATPLAFNVFGTYPAMNPGGVASNALIGIPTPVSVATTYYSVAERTGMVTSVQAVVASYTGNFNQISFMSSANTVRLFNNTSGGASFTATAADNALHFLLGTYNSTSSILGVDGVETTGSLNAIGTEGTDLFLSGYNGATFVLDGYWVEAGRQATAMSPTDRSALCHNVRLYWGSSGSC